MKTKFKSTIRAACNSFGVVCAVAVVLQFGITTSPAQTGIYLYTGSMTTITLNPGIYNITAYGAQGGGTIGYNGGLGAEMEAQFAFANPTTLTLLVGGAGTGGAYYQGGGGGGGSFFVNGTTPLVIAGGGGGSGPYSGPGASGVTQTSGGGGGGVLAGTGGSGGSGGNSSGDWDYSGGGGGGYFSDGGNGGSSFLNGGSGGSGNHVYSGSGGYGGGGGAGPMVAAAVVAIAAAAVAASMVAAAVAALSLIHPQFQSLPRFPASPARMVHPMARLLLPKSPNPRFWDCWPSASPHSSSAAASWPPSLTTRCQ